MTKEQFNELKEVKDANKYTLIGGYYYRAGSYGLSKHKRDRRLTKVGHCNNFRNKAFETVINDLKQPVQ